MLVIGACTALLVLLVAGCGGKGSSSSGASSGTVQGAQVAKVEPPRSCPATVVRDLTRVVRRVYREGVVSERTLVARRAITTDPALAAAIASGSAPAAQSAAQALIASGSITNLILETRAGRLADAGGGAVAPLTGAVAARQGRPAAAYTTSVWSSSGFLAEARSVSEGLISLRAGGQSILGSTQLPAGPLHPSGHLVLGGVHYQYDSFAGEVFPAGPMRVYVLRSLASIEPLCGSTSEETTVNTLTRVANLIFDGESGGRAAIQVKRVQQDPALLAAVAAGNPAATEAAVKTLLNQHIVRLRVTDSSGKLLADVGGPYVFVPVSASLSSGGHTIGHIVLSIQDDEGYLRLTKRLAGLKVMMYMGSQLVKNSVGSGAPEPPESGSYEFAGHRYRVYTLHATAFPSGPLTIHVLIPIPYT